MADQNTTTSTQGTPTIDLSQLQAGGVTAGNSGTVKKSGPSLEDEALMASAQGAAAPEKFQVPASVKAKFPDLVDLIKQTESMNDEERDYWFQILPIMNEVQIGKFREILITEKNQLKALDKEYDSELNKLNDKHILEWKEFENKEKRKKIQVAEQSSKEEERQAEEDLLRRLSST